VSADDLLRAGVKVKSNDLNVNSIFLKRFYFFTSLQKSRNLGCYNTSGALVGSDYRDNGPAHKVVKNYWTPLRKTKG
jgi:hypothetical protein